MAKEKTGADAPVVVDMTTAKTFELLPTNVTYLLGISAWKLGKSKSSEGRNIHVETTVMAPEEFAGRRASIEDISLDNEWTLGRIKTLLLACGYPKEQVEVKKFALPVEDEMMGRQFAAILRVEKDPNGQYPDKTRIARTMPKEKYQVASEA